MAPKTAASKSKTAAVKKTESKKTYKEMISAAIITLKDRNGSSRQAIKKYLSTHYSVGPNFDSQFNMALTRGVKAGDFTQPKGSSGPVKLAKKETKKPAAKKPVAKKPVAKKPVAKKAAPKKAAPKKAAPKKVTKKAAPKKAVKKAPAKKAKK